MTTNDSNSKPRRPRSIPALNPSRARKLTSLGIFVAVAATVWTPSSQSVASYPITLPWRGDSLEPGVYFRSAGHTGRDYGNPGWSMDFHAAKWVSPDWRTNDGGGQNEDNYIFGVPLYSPVDGEIIACWRTAPEKPSPSQDYDLDGDGIFGEAKNCSISGDICEKDADCPAFNTCVEGHDASPLDAGNFVVIRTEDEEHVVLLAHMQYGSIPSALCPLPSARDDSDTTSSPGWILPGADGWPDDHTDDCTGMSSSFEGYYRDTVLPTPVPVQEGEFLGRVGHSGASSRPHLHMHVKPSVTDAQGHYCENISEEMEFYEAWAQQCPMGQAASGSWSPLDGENPLEPWDIIGVSCTDDSDCNTGETCSDSKCVVRKPAYCFLPDAIGLQEDHDVFFNITPTNLHFTTHPNGDVLVYQSSGDLRLRSYDIGSNGAIIPQDTQNEGTVVDVAAARPLANARHIIVSIRGSNDNLKHIPYSVDALDGNITRMVGKELTESDVLQVESTPSPAHDGFVVAIEDDLGNLEVIDYHVDSDLDITRDFSGTGSGGAIDDVAITTMAGFEGVVTAEITTADGLVLRSFEVPAGGGVTNVDTYTAFAVGESVTIDRVPVVGLALDEYVVTSVFSSNQALRLDTWSIDSAGTIDWVDTISTGVVSGHDGTAGATIVGNFVMGVRDANDELRMIGWDVDWLGQIRRNSTRVLEEVSDLAIVASSAGGSEHIVGAHGDALGTLHLFTYAENYNGLF